MGYITRNANIILLFLILLSAVTLVGATVYFQQRFTVINTEYNAKLTQLKNISAQLEQYQSTLTTAKQELALKGSREEELTGKFTEVKGELQTLESEREALQTAKKNLEIALADKTSKLTVAQNTIAVRDTTIATLDSENADLRGDIITLEDDVDDLEDKVSCLQSTADASEGTC